MFAKLCERMLLNQVNELIQKEKFFNAVSHLIEALPENYANLKNLFTVFIYLAKALNSISREIFLK